MKKILLTAMMVAIVVIMTFGQGDAISSFFNKYENDESFTQVTISSKMFGLFTDLEATTPEDQEVLNAISKLKGLRILVKNDARNARELYKEAFTLIPAKSYEELMTVRDKDKDMKFFIKSSGDKISELLMVMGANSQFMVLSVYGDIDLKQISRIGKRMKVSGLENLDNLNKNHPNSKDNDKKD